MGNANDVKQSKSYEFFCEKERSGKLFFLKELAEYTGWKESTVSTYPTKKWDNILIKQADGSYAVKGINSISKEQYLRMMSQKNSISSDPLRPDLDEDVEDLVNKAKEAAMLALDIYNRPGTVFRTQGFIVMMIISWTALFHAIFQKRGIDYLYKNPDGTNMLIDGDEKAWELSECVKQFYPGTTSAITENIRFMIELRNKIEHRYVPAIDAHVAGECQALLLNFDELMFVEFGSYYAIREHLTVPLQTSSLRTAAQAEAIKKYQGKNYDRLKNYIDVFRQSLAEEISSDPKFSFRVFLVPKIGNHKSSSDVAFEFVKYDSTQPEKMQDIQKLVALIKEKAVPVANAGKHNATGVIEQVRKRTGRTFTQHTHQQALKHYSARVSKESYDPKYCQRDVVHKDWVYTSEWVELLCNKLSVKAEYDQICTVKLSGGRKKKPKIKS